MCILFMCVNLHSFVSVSLSVWYGMYGMFETLFRLCVQKHNSPILYLLCRMCSKGISTSTSKVTGEVGVVHSMQNQKIKK